MLYEAFEFGQKYVENYINVKSKPIEYFKIKLFVIVVLEWIKSRSQRAQIYSVMEKNVLCFTTLPNYSPCLISCITANGRQIVEKYETETVHKLLFIDL